VGGAEAGARREGSPVVVFVIKPHGLASLHIAWTAGHCLSPCISDTLLYI